MSSPLQVLCLSAKTPDLFTSAFGPFVTQACPSLEEASARLHQESHHALLIDLNLIGGVETLAAWTGLPSALLDTTVVVMALEPSWALCQRLVQLGVREIISTREVNPEMLGRVLRLAIERKRTDDIARRALSSDLATGLPNHSQLMEHMTHLLALREREPASMALIVLQLDGFRPVESAYGVEAANVLRRKAAVRLRASLRASDVVASLGSDMFAVLLAWIDAEDDGQRVAQKLVQTVMQPFQVGGQAVPITARAGVGQYPAHGRDAQSLLRHAATQASVGQLGRLLAADAAANDD